MKPLTEFKVVGLLDLLKLLPRTAKGHPRIERRDLGLPDAIVVTPPRFGVPPGDVDRMAKQNNGSYPDGSYTLPAPRSFLIRDCVVWSKYGLVLVDQYLVRESASHFPAFRIPEIAIAGYNGRETVSIRTGLSPNLHIDRAYHLMAGIVNNYYHWLFFVLAKLNPALLGDWWQGENVHPALLLPGERRPFQTETLAAAIDGWPGPSLLMAERSCVSVAELSFPVLHLRGGNRLHPLIKPVMGRIGKLSATPLPPCRIYISRSDTASRKITNEAEVEAFMAAQGYLVTALSRLTVQEQIGLFAAATHIVAPHGAGLSNLVFCRPGTKVLEIQTDFHVNWCYRHLSILYGLDYGCMVGHGEVDPKIWIHGNSWSFDIMELAAIMASPAFQ